MATKKDRDAGCIRYLAVVLSLIGGFVLLIGLYAEGLTDLACSGIIFGILSIFTVIAWTWPRPGGLLYIFTSIAIFVLFLISSGLIAASSVAISLGEVFMYLVGTPLSPFVILSISSGVLFYVSARENHSKEDEFMSERG